MDKSGFIKLINKGNAWSFILLFIRHPLNLVPTFLATYETVKISDEYYDKKHHKNNVTNAFRHALWNILIAKKCSKWRGNTRKAIRFAQKVTDWHEKFSPNEPLEREMDSHNNHVGRKIFIQNDERTTQQFVDVLLEKVEEAKMVYSVDDIKKYNNDLVFIEKLED
ncbi:hypothetical protein EGM88_02045 [Aureibaculum marinum]|uniref:DUF6973 domain-containing protein n=1 Tax=Aureibaculum marinum TaxID=2487930 RepID=A0A3N4NW51_9FLAO|nr:hypothetical protein [Aureibaculum marinum]RPE00066.1 hypothetical protein EGM88_02045 [Aureibaculum marinum]